MQTKRLNLGCGHDYKEGWINIDIDPDVKVDIRRDIERGLPFDDNSVDEVLMKDFVEHVKDTVFLFNEVYRVCKPDTIIVINMPSALCSAAFDFDHKAFFTIRQFKYIENKDEIYHYLGFKCRYDILELVEEHISAEHTNIHAVLKVVK